MDKLVRVIFSIAAFALIAAGVPKEAKAVLYNIQFNIEDKYQYTGAAVTGGASDYWNLNKGNSIMHLKDSSDLNTDVNLTFTKGDAKSTTEKSASLKNISINKIDITENAFKKLIYENLMSGYTSTGSLKTMTFTGLEKNKEYGLFVYTQGSVESKAQELTITATGSQTVTEKTNPNSQISTLIDGQNYIQMNAFSDGAGVLKVSYSSINDTAIINAIQLSSTAHAPEPASMVLLSVGGLLAAGRLRKNSHKKKKTEDF